VHRFALLPLLTVALTCLTFSCTNHSIKNTNVDYAQFDTFVEQTRQVYQVPGVVVGVVRDAGVVFMKGYGVRSVAGSAAVDIATKFQIASNTKFMAAASIGTLVDAGRSTWDQPLRQHYPALELSNPDVTAKVSFRDMLSHRSGLPQYEGDLMGRLGLDKAEMIRRSRYIELGSYGDTARYSNLGFFLAGEIGAQISDVKTLDWPAFLAKALFEPLGMTRSSGRPQDLYADENHVDGHRLKDDKPVLMDLEMPNMTAAGSVVSTGTDMARWLRMLVSRGQFEGGTVLKAETLDEMFKNAITTGRGGPLGEPGAGFGMGTENYTFLGMRVVTKNGALNGVRTSLALIPELKVGVFVLANLNLTVFPEAVIARFLEDHIGASGTDLQKYYKDVEQVKWKLMETPPLLPVSPVPLPVDPSQLAGSYSSALYGDVTVTADGTALKVATTTPTVYTGRLRHWSGMQFLLEWPDPDDMLGLVEFKQSQDKTKVTGFAGFMPDMTYMQEHKLVIINYGPFNRN
jgi:CubicO group peptidase (beta-lactamase class C family)